MVLTPWPPVVKPVCFSVSQERTAQGYKPDLSDSPLQGFLKTKAKQYALLLGKKVYTVQ